MWCKFDEKSHGFLNTFCKDFLRDLELQSSYMDITVWRIDIPFHCNNCFINKTMKIVSDCLFRYRVIQVTVFFNFSLADTKILKNGKTQPFLFRIYLDILKFWYLSMVRWKNLAFQGCANRHQLTSTGTFSHPQTKPGRVCGC